MSRVIRMLPVNAKALDDAMLLSIAIKGVADLLSPDEDLQAGQRDRVSVLVKLLAEKLDEALDRVHSNP